MTSDLPAPSSPNLRPAPLSPNLRPSVPQRLAVPTEPSRVAGPTAAVLLNSGGIDSRVSAAILRAAGTQVLSLYVDWNPRNSGAARAAAAITAEKYCADHEILPWGANWIAYLPRLRGWGHPYTNILGLTIGAAYARYREASAVASGVRPESSNGPRWRAAMNELLHASALSGSLDLLLPVYDLTDNAIIANAIALGVDLDTTHSCSQSEPPCGRCRSCQRHARAVAALK